MHILRISLAIAVLLLMVAACTPAPTAGEAQQSVDESKATLCESIEAYQAAVDALQQVDEDTPYDEAQELAQAADEAKAAMDAASADLDDTSRQLVMSTIVDYQDSLKDVEPDKSLGEAAPAMVQQASVIDDALAEISKLECE